MLLSGNSSICKTDAFKTTRSLQNCSCQLATWDCCQCLGRRRYEPFLRWYCRRRQANAVSSWHLEALDSALLLEQHALCQTCTRRCHVRSSRGSAPRRGSVQYLTGPYKKKPTRCTLSRTRTDDVFHAENGFWIHISHLIAFATEERRIIQFSPTIAKLERLASLVITRVFHAPVRSARDSTNR